MAGNEDYEIPDSGAVFTFGRSRFADNLSSHFFVKNDPVLEISCGDEHTGLVCKSGRVFLFGKNDFGQLGFGHTKVVNKPSCLKFLKPFQSIHVACGKSHTLISTACCRLFSFGCNSDGQLGLGDLNDRTVPQMVATDLSEDDSIIQISAGSHHSAFLTGKGQLYLWGNNSDGQCGQNPNKQLLIPQKLEFQEPITSISCGYYHTAFISQGLTYTFGEEDNGKLGRSLSASSEVPEKVEISENSVSVQCGGSHTVILTECGKVYTFGSNFSGQLGIGNFESEFSIPQLVDFLDKKIQVNQIACGESHTAFVTDDGVLYTCGDARHGKLCNEDELTNLTSPTTIDCLKNYFCTSVSCGGCHTMVLAKVRNSDNDKDATLLPPLKLKKDASEFDNVVEELKVNESEETPILLEKGHNEPEEFDTKSNTESNLNEEIISHDDDINNEIQEHKSESISYNNSEKEEEERSIKELDEAENDLVITRKESAMKRFFSVFKGKKSSAKASTEEIREQAHEEDITVEVKGNPTSKACIIL